MIIQLPRYLESIITTSFVKPRVKAVRVNRSSDGTVVINSETDPSISIFFKYEQEYHYKYYFPERDDAPYTFTEALRGDVHEARRTLVRSLWLERAARDGETVLQDNEIADFASFFENATFGFVEIYAIDSNVSVSAFSIFFVYMVSSPPGNQNKETSYIQSDHEKREGKESPTSVSETT